MNRRNFLKKSSFSLSALALVTHLPLAANSSDNPAIISVIPNGENIALPLQQAFEQAYQMWASDPLSRRPVIQLPEGQFTIDDITNNNRGQYPFHLPPTFKLIGAGATQTSITCAQPRGSQYRFLAVLPETRLDILADCPSANSACVIASTASLGPSFAIEVADITFNQFDNAILFQEARDCYVHDCGFNSSLVAVQLTMESQHGNRGHIIERCEFTASDAASEADKFCLRFEAPFSNLFTRVEMGVASQQACVDMGGSETDYDPTYQSCVVPDDNKLNNYINSLFNSTGANDIANRDCTVKHCDFYYSTYSAIEFAGKLNVYNNVSYCGFYQCSGTAVEFDKGASFNTVEHCVFSGMKPTTAYAPSTPYIFQAAVQEQEGSRSVDARIKSLIAEQGYADPTNGNYKGADIFYRAASLPQGNRITDNQFDVSRSYWLAEYEPNSSKHANLPDVYPTIKLSCSYQTVVANNVEFIRDPSLKVTENNVMGQSLVMYQNDNLRDNRGGVQITQNQFFGAWFLMGVEFGLKDNQPLTVTGNSFGVNDGSPRGGLSVQNCLTQQAIVDNNTFHCAQNANSAIFRQFDINQLSFRANHLSIPAGNNIYIRSQDATGSRSNVMHIEDNTIDGGHALYIYDYSSSSNASDVTDSLHFNRNTIKNMSGSGRVLAVTLWVRYIESNSNRYENIENKVFQQYSLSDTFTHDGNNSLVLSPSSQNRVYSRNYANSSGRYITNDYWVS